MGRLLVLVLVVAACTTGSTADPPMDAPPFTPPGMIAIRVRNDSARVLYVQASGWSGQEVTTVLKAGATAMGRDTCEVCNCATCPSCAVCGRSIARVAPIDPGGTLDFMWDQTDWKVVEDGCRPTLACEEPALVPAGSLTARARYSTTFTTTTMFGPEESFIGPALSADTLFQHPALDVVVIPIQ